MPDDDQPPESIWLNTEALEEHFARVRRKYESKSGGMEPVPEASMQDNEFTAALLK